MKPAIAYCRVSTARQAEQGISLETQESKIRAWAAANDYEIAAVYVDEGKSAKDLRKRPEAQKAIDHACREQATLVFYNLSRLARSLKDAIAIAERIQKAGAGLVSISESINLDSATGRFIYNILCAVNQLQRDITSETTIDNLAHVAANGCRIGQVKYGYMLDKSRVEIHRKTHKSYYPHLIENPDEQAVIARIRQLAGQGLTLTAIAETLFAERIRTRTGGEWDASAVRRILNGRSPAVGHARRQE